MVRPATNCWACGSATYSTKYDASRRATLQQAGSAAAEIRQTLVREGYADGEKPA